MKTVPTVRLADTADAVVLPELPEEIQLALTDIAGAAREGLLAMSVAAGLAVMQAMFEAEIAAACGPKGKHDPDRTAVRHGGGRGSVTLGGRRVPVARPRARTLDEREVALSTYAHFAAEDLLTQVVMERMLAGVATRRHARTAEPVGAQVGEEAKSTSRSAISRRFVRQTETALAELMARDLSELDIKVLMLDGEHLAERCVVVALAITADGTKKPVGLWDGSTENKTVVRALLADLVSRGLKFDDGLLVVLDGAKALSAAVREVFGDKALIQRCTLHKRRITSPITCPTRTSSGWTPSWSRRSAIPTLTPGCATPNTLPGNWIRATPVRPPACARGWRRCSPSPASASTAAWPRR
jgi:transposase-like protein